MNSNMRCLVAFLRVGATAAICSGSGSGYGCGACIVGCTSCMTDGSCSSRGCRPGLVPVYNGPGTGVVGRVCAGSSASLVYSAAPSDSTTLLHATPLQLCVFPSSNPNINSRGCTGCLSSLVYFYIHWIDNLYSCQFLPFLQALITPTVRLSTRQDIACVLWGLTMEAYASVVRAQLSNLRMLYLGTSGMLAASPYCTSYSSCLSCDSTVSSCSVYSRAATVLPST